MKPAPLPIPAFAAATFAILALVGCRSNDPPGKFDANDVAGYMARLGRSDSAEAKDIRARLKSASADLVREREEARKEGIAIYPSDLVSHPHPAPDDAAPLYTSLAQVLKPIKSDQTAIYPYHMSPENRYTAAQVDQARRERSKYSKLLNLAHAISERKHCSFPRNWTAGLVATVMTTPELNMRPAVWVIKSEAYLLARDGRFHEAIAEMSRAFRIAKHAADDLLPIAYLVQVGIDAEAVHGMQNLIRMAAPNASVLAAIKNSLIVDRPRYDLKHWVALEPVLQTILMAQFRQQPEQSIASLVDANSSSAMGTPPKWSAEEKRFVANLLDAAEAEYLRRIHTIYAAASLPYVLRREKLAGIVRPALDATGRLNLGSTTDNPIQALAQYILGVSTETLEAGTSVDAAISASIAATDVLDWKVRHGSYPEQLPGNEPADPFTGKPLKYRREPKGFVIYSVGPTGTFDGGKPGAKPETNEAYFRFPGDPPRPYEMPLDGKK